MTEIIFSNLNFSKMVWIVLRRLFLIILITCCTAFIGYYAAKKMSKPTYQTYFTAYVYGDIYDYAGESVSLKEEDYALAIGLSSNYGLMVKNTAILNEVIKQAGISYTALELQPMITTSLVESTPIVYVYVKHSDPEITLEVANALAKYVFEPIRQIIKTGGAEIVDYPAGVSAIFSSSTTKKYTLYGAIGGFLLSFMIIFLKGLLNPIIYRYGDINGVVEKPILSVIPRIKGLFNSREKIFDSPDVVNAYEFLKTKMSFIAKHTPNPVYVITSADKNEGKTALTAGFAMSLVLSNCRVLLIDADLRERTKKRKTVSLGDFMNQDKNINKSDSGLADYLQSNDKIIHICKSDNENLDYIKRGNVTDNPSDLLASERFAELIAELRYQYDAVVIDTTSIDQNEDALEFQRSVSGYLIAVRSGVSKIDRVKKVERLIGRKLFGFIYINNNNYKVDKE